MSRARIYHQQVGPRSAANSVPPDSLSSPRGVYTPRRVTSRIRLGFRGGRSAWKAKLVTAVSFVGRSDRLRANKFRPANRAKFAGRVYSGARNLRSRSDLRPRQRRLPHLLPRRQHHVLLPQLRQLDHDPPVQQSRRPVVHPRHRTFLRRMVRLLPRALPRRLLSRLSIQPPGRITRACGPVQTASPRLQYLARRPRGLRLEQAAALAGHRQPPRPIALEAQRLGRRHPLFHRHRRKA